MKKVYNCLLCCLFFFLPGLSHSQQTVFSKVYFDTLHAGTEVYTVVETFNNAFIVAGGASAGKGLVLKIDSLGNLLWQKSFYGNSTSYSEVLFNVIIATNDSCFLLAGNTYNVNHNTLDALCVKINTEGDTLWSSTFGQNNTMLNVNAIEQTSDSGFIMAGNADWSQQIFAAKIDKNGTFQWINVLTICNNSCAGYCVRQTLDSGFIVGGYFENFPPYDPNAFLIKFSALGAVDWAKKYHPVSPGFSTLNDLIITSEGFFCFLFVNSQIAFMQTDFQGNVIWSKCHNQPGGGGFIEFRQPRLHKTPDQNYAFVFGPGPSYTKGFAKADTLGNLIWNKQLKLNAQELLVTKDSGILIVGNGPIGGVKQLVSFPHIGIVKTDSLGNGTACTGSFNYPMGNDPLNSSAIVFTSVVGGLQSPINLVINPVSFWSYNGCVDFVGEINESDKEVTFTIYPNPTAGMITITSSNQRSSLLTIYNVLGAEVYSTGLIEQQTEIDLRTQPNGIYFFRFTGDGENVETFKLLINK